MDIPYPKTISISSRKKKLLEDYVCSLPNGDKLFISEGSIYDGASIPKIFWNLVGSPFTGKYQRAAFIHDALYAAKIYPRKSCDELFLCIMKLHGCEWLTRNIIWSAVRSFGGFAWNKHNKTMVSEAKQKICIIE